MKKIIWGFFVAMVLGGLAPKFALAARPLITEDADTLGKGSAKIEAGLDYARDNNGDKYFFSSLQLAYGLRDRLEIAATLPYFFLYPKEGARVDGVGDLYAYLRYRVWEEKGFYPALALKPILKIPIADENKGLGSGKTDFGFNAAFSKSFSGFNLNFDATYVFYGEKNVTDQLLLGLAGEFEIAKGFNLVSEIRYGNNFNSGRKDDAATLMVGFQAEALGAVFDAGVAFGLNSAAPDYVLTAGVTLKFK
jgi:hypothetical protein